MSAFVWPLVTLLFLAGLAGILVAMVAGLKAVSGATPGRVRALENEVARLEERLADAEGRAATPALGATPPATQVEAYESGPQLRLDEESMQVGTRRLPSALVEEIRRLEATGKKIRAIKLLRDRTGLGLKEAKDAVETIAAGRY